jgi:hypothetical protein
MLDRANDLLEAADKLDDAVANLQAFRCLLKDLNARTKIDLPQAQVHAVEMVRAGILRSAIALVVAILDWKGRDRASLGQISEALKDHTFLQFLETTLYKGRGAVINRKKLQDLCNCYHKISTAHQFEWVKQLRHDEIGHLLMRNTPSQKVEYADIFALTDEIERQVIMLYEGLGIHGPRFGEQSKETAEKAVLFWNTYFAGVGVSRP